MLTEWLNSVEVAINRAIDIILTTCASLTALIIVLAKKIVMEGWPFYPSPMTFCNVDYNRKEGMEKFLPAKAYPGSIGFDLRATGNVLIPAGGRAKVPFGFNIEFPEGYYGKIFGRSGLGHNKGLILTNGTTIIDPDYLGDVFVSMTNLGNSDYQIKVGDAVAQMVLERRNDIEVRLTPGSTERKTKRGKGGFGSSGVKWVK